MGYELKDDEMAVVLKPVFKNGYLESFRTGLAIGNTAGENQEVGQVQMDAALSMAAVLMYCSDYPEFEEVLADYKSDLLKEIFPEQWAEAEREVTQEEGYRNVIRLDAWTKTEGNA